jgi:hypothetical protein
VSLPVRVSTPSAAATIGRGSGVLLCDGLTCCQQSHGGLRCGEQQGSREQDLHGLQCQREPQLDLDDDGQGGVRDFLDDNRCLSFSGSRGHDQFNPVGGQPVVGAMHPVAEEFPGDIDANSESGQTVEHDQSDFLPFDEPEDASGEDAKVDNEHDCVLQGRVLLGNNWEVFRPATDYYQTGFTGTIIAYF